MENLIAARLSWFNLDPEYAALLRAALVFEPHRSKETQKKPISWGLLPELCCQAAGGQEHLAELASAAWMLFYAAADIMDSAQDQDEPASWWAEAGPGVALSAATGFFFCASSFLNDAAGQNTAWGPALIKDFHSSFLEMSSGQYADLTHLTPSLDKYWEIASAKSGSFFALACRTGARIAGQSQEIIHLYGEFGRSLGLLIQVLDDLDDLHLLSHSLGAGGVKKVSRSLPVVYAMQVLPEQERMRLVADLQSAERSAGAAEQAFLRIEQCGAVLYLISEMRRYQSLALQNLELTEASGPAQALLVSLIQSFNALS